MDFKRYWNEVITSIGVISLILLFIQLSSNRKFTGNFEIVLLRIYIICVMFTFLTYHLFPKIIKNFQQRKKLFYTVVVIEFTVLFTLIDVIFNFITLHEKNLYATLLTIPSLIVILTVTYIIIYFAEKAYYKRMNKKLDEYKQQNDDNDNAG